MEVKWIDVKERGEIIKQWIDGKTLQYHEGGEWMDVHRFAGSVPFTAQHKLRIKPRPFYVNVYRESSCIHDTREAADLNASKNRIACLKGHEGQFDD